MTNDDWDRCAEDWLRAQHGPEWYIGSATKAEWDAAYQATDPALTPGDET